MQGLMMKDGSLRYVNSKEDFLQLIQEFMGSDSADYYSNYKIEDLEQTVSYVRTVLNDLDDTINELDDAIDALEGVVYG